MINVYLEFLEETLGRNGETGNREIDAVTENMVRQILNGFNQNEQRLLGQNRLKGVDPAEMPLYAEAMLTYWYLVASEGAARAFVEVLRHYYEQSPAVRKMIEEAALLRRDGVEELLLMVLNNKAPQMALEQQLFDDTLNLKQRTAAAVALCEGTKMRHLPQVLKFYQSLPRYKGSHSIDEYARSLADNLHKFGPEAVESIMQTLLTCHKDLTYHLFRTVGALGLPALYWIQQQLNNSILNDGDWFRLCNCLGHLARYHQGAVELLGEIIARGETYSHFAIEQLGKIGNNPLVREILLSNLQHRQTQIRAKVITAMTSYPCAAGLAAAREAIQSRVPELRLAGAEYLARRGEANGLEILLTMVRSGDGVLMRKAGNALNRVGVKALEEVRNLLSSKLAAGEQEALVKVLACFKNQPQRTEAALLAARLLVEDPERPLASSCAQTLRELQVTGGELRRLLEQGAEHKKVKDVIRYLYHGGLVSKKTPSGFGQGLLEELG